ncbi:MULTISPECIES: helix-turn-helix transcriptional regulator [unclassified Sphingopyxis]|uniref:helix-turn-helix transcriptional regulator n=1 Tax=unclassified Sphingopyxis TaxID=2614943 RepID=UPI002859788C|nr:MULTISPECIES: helix-turn-helix transcriptional regulator [unclassified Sphingopyxis]MDR6833927.1 DNA-binding CsgD family transcriptional regulator [Sphingopyxis sp. BE122]MDR7226196.1 DNA-binding CsgD family transcriptional regulator [Sphingopyxis sp. BE259]
MSDSGSHPSDEAARWARLTDKQRACLDLLVERQTSKQIARQLNISKQAVDLRLTTARDVLGAANRDETAILYARLRSTYDRIPCDPVILPPRPELVPSDFPDGEPVALALNDHASFTKHPIAIDPPFKGLWRRDHSRSSKVWIMAAMFAGLILLMLAGVTIGETLTRLISG